MGIKISNLPAIVSPSLTDLFPVVQSGVTYKETVTQLTTLVEAHITSLTGLTGIIQAPTYINDANGNHVLSFSSTPNAVNYLTILNQSTGNPPQLRAAGTDTNVGMVLLMQGTGQLGIQSTNTTPLSIYSGTALQHVTNFTFANTAQNRTITFPDDTGTVSLTGTLVAGNLVKASTAYTVVDQGFAMKSVAGAAAAGGAAAQSFTDAFCTSGSCVIGNWNTQANAVQVLKIVPGNGSFVVTSSGDAGVGTFNYIITK
ncbi:hypothetical protein UFOVP100_8 [uncultured Caudovirales phage]|uniref:Uncharacterized protein n=1 Tax=uncultured Caudovirales phage TaxID=2100421 RepID=A0A6J5L4A6_9CAUD|nr:hypothetical protein UFOVP100_8 [uncultured Caudovirales phage]